MLPTSGLYQAVLVLVAAVLRPQLNHQRLLHPLPPRLVQQQQLQPRRARALALPPSDLWGMCFLMH